LKSLDWRGLDRLSLSPDGRFIAYAVLVEQGKADREIRILASDGSREAIVAAAPGINVSPVWSRDGSELVFMSDRSGAFGIWSIAVRDGRAAGSPTRLKADVGNIRLIGFTASSSLLYDQTIGSRDVFQIALDARGAALSGEPRSMIDRFQGWNWHPAESPDGQSLAYLSRRPGIPDGWANLIIRSLESGAERVMPTLMRAGGGGGGIPIWLPDGHSLIVPTRNSQNHTVLTKIDVRSGDVVTLVDTGGSNPNAAALSPDGRTAYAFAGAPVLAGAYDLASGRRVDFSHAGNAKSIAASPDGHLVAFIAWESDRVPTPTHLYVADVETRRVRAILTSEKSDDMISGIWGGVDWSPDSRFIYFLRQNQGALWRIAAAGGAPTLVGELAKQPVRTIDVSRDGRHVIFATDQRSDTVEVWTLENVLQAGRRPSP